MSPGPSSIKRSQDSVLWFLLSRLLSPLVWFLKRLTPRPSPPIDRTIYSLLDREMRLICIGIKSQCMETYCYRHDPGTPDWIMLPASRQICETMNRIYQRPYDPMNPIIVPCVIRNGLVYAKSDIKLDRANEV